MASRPGGPGSRFAVLPVTAVIIAALVTAGAAATSGSDASVPRSASAAGTAGTAGRAETAKPAGTATGPSGAHLALPLKGVVIGIDPGHNGRDYTAPAYIDHQVWNGREWESCDTTGTATNGGYTEARFNFRVAGYLRADLVRDGATVVMTRTSDNGVGPCVNTRSYILNEAHASVAVDIHADGAYCTGCRGFAILEPVADGPNDAVIASSARLGADVRAAMLAGTPMPVSDYDGKDGINHRDDLAGLNLTRVPKILIEVGNMKNATDARLLTSAKFQQQAARALLAAILTFEGR